VIVALLILSLIGVAIISVLIAVVATHFILRGIEVLLPIRCRLHQKTANDNECETGQPENGTSGTHGSIYPLNIRRCDLYEVIRTRINEMRKNKPTNDECPNNKRNAKPKEYYRYINRHRPPSPQHPFPIPRIEHIRTIVNRLRRRVNQSGKEPQYRCRSHLRETVL
jgi:hypothetical protein